MTEALRLCFFLSGFFLFLSRFPFPFPLSPFPFPTQLAALFEFSVRLTEGYFVDGSFYP
jgi:hypothetical protein